MNPADPSDRQGGFPTTSWTRIARAGGRADTEGRTALASLCAGYWYPIYAYIRRHGHDADDAHDLAQEFFARLIEKGTVTAADPARGRFRAFLLADCRYFLADSRDRANARKRGGDAMVFRLDARDAESRYHLEPAHLDTPERLFDRAWAMALLDRTMDAVARHYAATGRSELFEQIRPALVPASEAPPHAEIGSRLGMTPGAVQVAVHRARARFGRTLRELVADTLDDPDTDEVEDEIRGLFAALGG